MHVNLMDIAVNKFLDHLGKMLQTKHSKNGQIAPNKIHPDVEIYLIL